MKSETSLILTMNMNIHTFMDIISMQIKYKHYLYIYQKCCLQASSGRGMMKKLYVHYMTARWRTAQLSIKKETITGRNHMKPVRTRQCQGCWLKQKAVSACADLLPRQR